MTPAQIAAARSYLAPPRPEFWHWDDEQSAIAWLDGPTITLRQELAVVLASQPNSGRGLPELTVVLLILSACRESWHASRTALERALEDLYPASGLPRGVVEVLDRLEDVHKVARDLFQTAQRKSELLWYLFADQPNRETDVETADEIVELLAKPALQLENLGRKPADLWHTFMSLRSALERFDPDEFLAWCDTGLEQEVKPAPLEVEYTSGQRVRMLLTELNDDEELGGVARLARQLLAAIALPRPLAEPDDLPLGGVSDIANRGALDRLLLSELAYDDLTLAVRIATGEALYYRRETPPKSPPLRRMIVLDSGLRQWGVPRVFITSVGLALAAAGDERLAIEAYRARGEELVEVDLTRKDGLQQQLAALETDLHLGKALPAIQQLQLKNADGENLPSDVVLVTSDDALADEEFRKQLRAANLDGAWIAAINRAGRVRLMELGLREMVLKRECRFDLAEILTPARKPLVPLVTGDGKLPAFCRLKEVPLRIPHDLSIERAWSIGDQGVLAIYKDYRLTWWTDTVIGPQQLADNMPRGRVLWADSVSEHAPYRAVVGTLSVRGLYALQVWPGERDVSVALLKHNHQEQFTTVTATAEHIFLIGPHRAVAFAWSGEELATCKVVDRHLGGRYFLRNGTQFVGAITVRGDKIGLTAGYTLKSTPAHQILGIAGEREVPQVIRCDGYAIDLISGHASQLITGHTLPVTLLAQSRDNRTLVLQDKDRKQVVVRLDKLGCRQVWGDPAYFAEEHVAKFMGSKVNLRQHFHGIYVTARGDLALRSRKGLELTLDALPRMRWRDSGRSEVRQPQLRPFANVDAPSGYLLQRATWDDGSQAWLDSRGLLHLRSSNPQVAELTLILQDGETAGWSSTHGLFGSPYFTGTPALQETPHSIRRTLHAFSASLVSVVTT
ncbi:aminoglycoside phosphotransferase family protein [Anatilimnocola floriformis]|uniref:aminoglycoside phosphotransferase family protein n=1 Tax=Anatilimnocola floriformis TaxID=2948575 RepID=UPI0020C26716|nr:aminoglycoside phosphotransferase family protein [Anatilimnocola floriformis]